VSLVAFAQAMLSASHGFVTRDFEQCGRVVGARSASNGGRGVTRALMPIVPILAYL
jgi:hypothetical protein